MKVSKKESSLKVLEKENLEKFDFNELNEIVGGVNSSEKRRGGSSLGFNCCNTTDPDKIEK